MLVLDMPIKDNDQIMSGVQPKGPPPGPSGGSQGLTARGGATNEKNEFTMNGSGPSRRDFLGRSAGIVTAAAEQGSKNHRPHVGAIGVY